MHLHLFEKINTKINGLIFSLVFTSILLIALAVFIVWHPMVLQVLVAGMIVSIALTFLHIAHKIWSIRKDVKNHFKL